MDINKFFKEFQRDSVRYIIYSLAWIFGWMPYKLAKKLTSFLLYIAYSFLKRPRRIANESMVAAFGKTKTGKEREVLIRKCFENLGQSIIEILQFMSHPDSLEAQVTVEGQHHLDEALKKGKGVIGVTGHFGNFAFMMLYTATQGYKTNCIIRPQHDEKLGEYLKRRIEAHNFYAIYSKPRRKCVVEAMRVLRNNELLFIPIDQNFGADGGVYVNFFGKQASTATGPVIFAQRTGATLLPMFIVRESDELHRIVIKEPYELVEKKNEQETLQYNMQQLTSSLQEMIEAHPAEWTWMHHRWKTQPNPLLKGK